MIGKTKTKQPSWVTPAQEGKKMSEFKIPRDAITTTCVVAGVDMDVIYSYEAPDYIGALVHGHRGLIEIYTVIHNDADLILVLNEETIGDIEKQLLEQHEEQHEDRDYY